MDIINAAAFIRQPLVSHLLENNSESFDFIFAFIYIANSGHAKADFLNAANTRVVCRLAVLASVALAHAFVRLNIANRAALAFFVFVGAQQAVGTHLALRADLLAGMALVLHVHALGAGNIAASMEKWVRQAAYVVEDVRHDLLFVVAMTVADVALREAGAFVFHSAASWRVGVASLNALAYASGRIRRGGATCASVSACPAPCVCWRRRRPRGIQQALAVGVSGAPQVVQLRDQICAQRYAAITGSVIIRRRTNAIRVAR